MASRQDRDERVERLRAARTHRASEALALSNRAITALEARGFPVTWESVAEAAGVSTSYLRKHEDLSKRIRELSNAGPTSAPPPHPRAASESTLRGLRNKVELMSERLQRYEAENASLRADNAALPARSPTYDGGSARAGRRRDKHDPEHRTTNVPGRRAPSTPGRYQRPGAG